MGRFARPSLLALLLVTLSHSAAAFQDDELARHVTPEELPVRVLDATDSFHGLSEKEKLYAHWMGVASWLGSMVTFDQVSAESPALLEMFQRLYSKDRIALRKAATRRGVSDKELRWLRQYAACFYSNMGNYLSFGDTKFIPRISREQFAIVVDAAARLADPVDTRLLELWSTHARRIYSLGPDERQLGIGSEGRSNYYGENVTSEDIALVKAFMVERKLEAWNTRLFKDDASGVLTVRIAAAKERTVGPIAYKGNLIILEYGDHAAIMKRVAWAFGKALPYAANAHQRKMIESYIAHFQSGEIRQHKAAMEYWVKDVGPVVETNIGFIETYRDPIGVRAEWEGFVAIVNKEQTKHCTALVEQAPPFISRLPWGPGFEKDAFSKPDFTSLDVLAFANSGIPAGINIPNYDDIRQNLGFKNVSLGNVLSSGGTSKARITFLADSDQELYRTLTRPAFKVQVGLHELLGHGSGKLLEQRADGSFNFDRKLLNPVTNQSVASWYKPGQSWGSVFSTISSSFEECRAEAVGLYLSLDPEILRIFGHEGRAAADVTYINWLLMARSGLAALPYFNPDKGRWGQAHVWARFALMNVMLRDGNGMLKIEKNDAGDWLITLDRKRIATDGKRAIGAFLQKLNVYKATANFAAGKALYDDYTLVDERFLEIRNYALSKRKARHIWTQPVTDLDEQGNVVLRTYPGTYQGVIDSFLDRFAFLASRALSTTGR